jgi:hypothetical protein
MQTSLHDNWIYAHCVDHDSRLIVLYTLYPHGDTWEYTDVIFEEVLVHHFETQCMSDGSAYPSNVLFDIETEDSKITLGRYWDFIVSKRNYSWPVSGWANLEDLAQLLARDGHSCFHVHGTAGLDGFVFARRMLLKSRTSRWTANSESHS